MICLRCHLSIRDSVSRIRNSLEIKKIWFRTVPNYKRSFFMRVSGMFPKNMVYVHAVDAVSAPILCSYRVQFPYILTNGTYVNPINVLNPNSTFVGHLTVFCLYPFFSFLNNFV